MYMMLTNPRRRAAFFAAIFIGCAVLSGCGKTFVSGPERTARKPEVVKPVAPRRFSAADAEAALNAGQTARAEQIATRLTSQPGLGREETARASRVLALAAVKENHPYLAMTALERWLSVDAAADESSDWRQTFVSALDGLQYYDARTRADGVVADARRPFALRAGAALYLAARQWERGEEAQALSSLQALYVQAGQKGEQAQMEHSLFARLQETDAAVLGTLESQTTDENSKAFPYALVRLESLRRKALYGSTREEAQMGAEALAEETTLADPGLLLAWDSAPLSAAVVPLAGRTLVLALPLSGSLRDLGKKVAQGAEEARNEFLASGHSVGLVFLDTENPQWLETLASYPPEVTVVGGPLRLSDFAAAHARGLTQTRAFLTFTPSLGEAGEEGRVGWRFFPSVEDQMAALFSVADQFGITRYAVLMPDNDSYSAKMADIFTEHVRSGGGEVVRRAEYPKNDPSQWNKFVGSFLRTNKRATRAPATPHEAVFLPDYWRNMESIVPNLFYFLETRQLLLGTSLWEQGLAATDHVAAHYYNLAVFPGAWDKTATARANGGLFAAYAKAGLGEPDFWAGLGYDFVRFASTLDIPPGWTPDAVNAALARNTDMLWSMAPIAWSAQGKAEQRLFLFTPSAEGAVPADLPAMEARFRKAWNR